MLVQAAHQAPLSSASPLSPASPQTPLLPQALALALRPPSLCPSGRPTLAALRLSSCLQLTSLRCRERCRLALAWAASELLQGCPQALLVVRALPLASPSVPLLVPPLLVQLVLVLAGMARVTATRPACCAWTCCQLCLGTACPAPAL